MSRTTPPSPLPFIRRALADQQVGSATVEVTRSGSGYQVEVEFAEADDFAVGAAMRLAEAEYRAATSHPGRRW